MDLQQLLREEQRIQRSIRERYIDPNAGGSPIYDGVVNPEYYLSCAPRVLWILKEPYCDGNARTGGDWSLSELLNKKTDEMARHRTFQPICYINYGVFSGKGDWDQMPWLRESEEIRLTLKRIAFINICKLPGLKHTPGDILHAGYEQHRELIWDQITTYAPHIIFAGGPHGDWLAKDRGFKNNDWEHFGSASALNLSPQTRLVSVYHPVQRKRGLTRKLYVNDAIQSALSGKR